MAIQNKTLTLLGASVKLEVFQVYPQADGSYVVSISGVVTDGAGGTQAISTRATFGSGVAVLNNMAAAALQRLRVNNGLET